MAYLIDTNIAVHARDGAERVLDKLAKHDGAVLLSPLSLAELQRGLYRTSEHASLRRARLKTLLQAIPVLPFDAAAVEAYGWILSQLGWTKGRDFDGMIGAHALASGSVMVTANLGDFSDIPGLTIENWTVEA